ncbi:MAG: translesion error-prone DNA polymerase V autoproteolytic subunit [Candidatus Omnitrophica bacterium]|nr:translesion error-prone DNA polymerase V autoproteolytic subunit [Candidatus Omnitrophota bacterium]
MPFLCVPKSAASIKLPLYLSPIRAGFPSPADDYIEKQLDLNEHLIKHPAATFLLKATGNSMINAGIFPGDLLIVDRSLEAVNNKIVVAVLNGEFTVKRLRKRQGRITLLAENPNFPPIEIPDEADFEIWGVVAHVLHTV